MRTSPAGQSPCASHRPGRPRRRPDHVIADKAYSSRGFRAYLRRRGIAQTIPEKVEQQRHRHRHRRGSRGGRPLGFNREAYRRRNLVERCFNRLKGFRGIARPPSAPSARSCLTKDLKCIL
ncbi:transposase [Streptomyces pharetrae]|uniref:transposase n=1 Tax=Streptomyces pharetrae TaxID=291370 RepID=UPI00369173E6